MARTPENTSDAEINAMTDACNPGFRPMVAALNALAPKPEIDLRRRYDIHVDYKASAPKHSQFQAIDWNSFDPAPDSRGVSTCIGYGATRQEARLDLLDQIAGFDAAKNDEPTPRPRVGRTISNGNEEPADVVDVRDDTYDVEEQPT